jgi:hypothetical protein
MTVHAVFDRAKNGTVRVPRRKFMKRMVSSRLIGRAFLGMTAAFLLALLCVAPLRAQVDAGAILGTVTDASGSAIHGATVTLTNEGTSAALSTTTGNDGIYKFTPVKIGSYKLTVTFQGFETITRPHVPVNVGENVVADFTLKPGNVTTTVEVTAAAPVLQSQDASVGQVIDSKSVNDLPLNGRNFTFLAQLAAGVNSPQADTRGNAASGAFSANGLRPAQNNYLLDGIDNNSDTVDFLNGTNYVVLPPVDAVEEFKVQTSDFSAEFGRSGAAVLNATIKSGTNEFHGDVWEFFRNDKLDAADFFENQHQVPKGDLQQNQFGFTAGGPVYIPKLFNGKNKVFIFGDYQALRRVQGTILSGSVPSVAERNSGYTNFQDLIAAQPCGGNGQPVCPTDALGRTMPLGTILNPATTRQLPSGAFVREPFGTCVNEPAGFVYTVAGCNLNILPATSLDQNAIALLNLYPLPTTNAVGSLLSNYANSPKLYEHSNSFDTRMDINFSEKNQLFFRFSLVDDPQFIPGIFGGVADGGGFQQGTQTAIAEQSALGYTHTFSPTLINEVRAGLNYLHTTRVSPSANDLSNIPGEFGILGVPQQALNGGLPAFGINGLSTLGSNAFLPSDEVTSTFQLTDSVTKIYGKHTFKMGFEWQHVKFSTLQPPWSRGEYDYNGDYTEVPTIDSGNTGRADFLLIPAANIPAAQGNASCVAPVQTTCPSFLGGASAVDLSNISLTDNGKNYYGGYFNDDWKVSRKLTVNLGIRYDFFGLVFEHHGNQANFIPSGGPFGGAAYLLPASTSCDPGVDLSASFVALLAQDNILCESTNSTGKGLGNSQKNNFAPRVGFAYQVNPKLVVRGGFGIFYNGFENRGFSPNLGENYPFQFNFQYSSPNDVSPISAGTPFAGCPTAGGQPLGVATFESGFSCNSLTPLDVNASGLALRGIQFNYDTPYSMGGNLTLQYQLTPSLSIQAGYVTSLARHLESFPNSNNPTSIAPASTDKTTLVPFPDFGIGSSYAATAGMSAYHSLQTKVEKRFANGLNFLFTYTYSKTMSDAGDLLNGGSVAGYRAPSVPGLGMAFDYGLADFDIRNVFHFSGGYELPFGKGKRFASDASGVMDKIVGGWSINWSSTFQGGQPISLSCPSSTAAGLGCGALYTGQPLDLGLHNDANGLLSWFGNPAAFTQPCILNANPNAPPAPLGCVPLTGAAALGGVTQVPGPGFNRLDFSAFKDIPINERFRLQFRAEIFNIFNHPNFNAPNFGGNGVVAISGSGNYNSSTFGEIGSTRDAPYDPRQIQFALKLYF